MKQQTLSEKLAEKGDILLREVKRTTQEMTYCLSDYLDLPRAITPSEKRDAVVNAMVAMHEAIDHLKKVLP